MSSFFIYSGKVFLLFAFLSIFPIQRQDKIACEAYEKNLAIIKARLDKKMDMNLMDVYRAIMFFEKLTGIMTHSDGNAAGQFDPTEEDYVNWSNWLKKNKSKLYWDDKDQTVKVEGGH